MGTGKLPALRYWFRGQAVLGLISGAYWTIIAIIGLAPMIQRDLKWGLLAIGVLLLVLSWYALARAEEKAEAAEQRAEERHDHLIAAVKNEGVLTRDVVVAQIGSAKGAPLVEAIERMESVVIETGIGGLTATGYAPTVTVTLLKGAELLAGIRENPPMTDEAVRAAATQVGDIVVQLRGTTMATPFRATGVLSATPRSKPDTEAGSS